MEENIEHWCSSRDWNMMFIKVLPDCEVDRVNCFSIYLWSKDFDGKGSSKGLLSGDHLLLLPIGEGGKVAPCIGKMWRTMVLTNVAFFL